MPFKFMATRSKCEKQLQKLLKAAYPKLKIKYNDRKTLGYELDVYIPSLSLAVELNGPVHYKPIYGEETYTQVVLRDIQRERMCKKYKISLMIIDIQHLTKINEDTVWPIASRIITEIENRLSALD